MNISLDDYETETRTEEEILDSPTIRSRLEKIRFESDDDTSLLSQYGYLRSGQGKRYGWECPLRGARTN